MDRSEVRTVEGFVRRVSDDLAQAVEEATSVRGRAVLCLAGGATPQPIYRRLAERRELPWGRVWIAWGDERHVPPDDSERNERHAREALLDRVPVPEDQILPWPWAEDADPADVAEAYALRLRRALGDPTDAPWFDVTLLGLGADAHTAGLFPDCGATAAPGLATSLHVEGQRFARLTLTPRALSSSRRVWFLVQGETKRDALRRTLAGGDADALPATTIGTLGERRVYTDLAF